MKRAALAALGLAFLVNFSRGDPIDPAAPATQASATTAPTTMMARPWLGISYGALDRVRRLAKDDPASKDLKFPDVVGGVVIISTEDDGAAASAGIKRGDVVVKIGDVFVKDEASMRVAIEKTTIGRASTAIVWRIDGKNKWKPSEIKVTPQMVRTPAIAATRPNQEFGFRGYKWGVSRDDVKNHETGTIDEDLSDDANLLVYSGSVGGMVCEVAFIFVDNQLCRGKYIFSKAGPEKADYIYDYKKLKELLTEKYGKPTTEKNYDDPDGAGKFAMFTDWDTGGEVITVFTRGDRFKGALWIEYAGAKLAPAEKEKRKALEKNGL